MEPHCLQCGDTDHEWPKCPLRAAAADWTARENASFRSTIPVWENQAEQQPGLLNFPPAPIPQYAPSSIFQNLGPGVPQGFPNMMPGFGAVPQMTHGGNNAFFPGSQHIGGDARGVPQNQDPHQRMDYRFPPGASLLGFGGQFSPLGAYAPLGGVAGMPGLGVHGFFAPGLGPAGPGFPPLYPPGFPMVQFKNQPTPSGLSDSLFQSSIPPTGSLGGFGSASLQPTPEPSPQALELERIISQIRLSKAKRDEMTALFAKLGDICTAVEPVSQIFIGGSLACGFETIHSDLDVGWIVPGKLPEDAKVELMIKLEDALTKTLPRHSYRVKNIPNSKVPIVTVSLSKSGIAADISLASAYSKHRTALLTAYRNVDPRLTQLALLVKHWAQLRGVNDAKRHTINSFGYTLMCVHLLQHVAQPPILPCLQAEQIVVRTPGGGEKIINQSDIPVAQINGKSLRYFVDGKQFDEFGAANSTDISGLLVLFFEYFSKFDYSHHRISVSSGGVLPKESAEEPSPHRYSFYIEDPFDARDNVTRSVDQTHLSQILAKMRLALEAYASSGKFFDSPAELQQ